MINNRQTWQEGLKFNTQFRHQAPAEVSEANFDSMDSKHRQFKIDSERNAVIESFAPSQAPKRRQERATEQYLEDASSPARTVKSQVRVDINSNL